MTFGHSSRGGYGPDTARIVIIGEAYGQQEVRANRPFVGGAGNELKSWLRQAGISQKDVYYTNVINKQPPFNDFKKFCLKKKEAEQKYEEYKEMLQFQYPDHPWPSTYTWKPVASGSYLHPQHLSELPGLYAEIRHRNPNLLILCGNTPCWALLNQTGITKIRGAVAESILGIKAIPVLHPAAILRQYEKRPLSLVDMMKAGQEMKFSSIERPKRRIWLDPSLDDLASFDTILRSAHNIGCDIETEPRAGFIKMIGFSADEHEAIVIPFYDPRVADNNYWQDHYSEKTAWQWAQTWLNLPQPKIFQNGSYDITWLWAKHGITPRNWEDTLLQAHSLQPELPKDLGTLGSIYSSEPAWKIGRSATHKDAE